GFSRKQALQAMMPLVEGTIKNIKTIGLSRALTGPIARGDVATVKSHLSLIRKRLSNYLSFYREIGKYTVVVARAKGGISKKQARELTRLFKAPVGGRDKSL
ncbi:unnamed protein product, partial [marine sediment metagenome]